MGQLIRIKIHKNKKFATIGLAAVEDPRLNWKSKGIHTYLMSRPPDWVVQTTDLLRRARDRKSSLYAAVEELRKHGYLVITRDKDEKGRFIGTTWEVYEDPLIPYPEKQDVDNPYTEKPCTEKNTHTINHSINNKIKDTTTTNKVVVNCQIKEKEYNEKTVNVPIKHEDISRLAKTFSLSIGVVYFLADLINSQIAKGMRIKESYFQMLFALCKNFKKNPSSVFIPEGYLSPAKRQRKFSIRKKLHEEQANKKEEKYREWEDKFNSLPLKVRKSFLEDAKKKSPFTKNPEILKTIAVHNFVMSQGDKK